MAELSIIIVNYNAGPFLRKCLDSIYTPHRDIDLETIVIDNNSTDGSCNDLGRDHPQVRLIQRSQNEGFARANNVGIEASGGKYVLLLNCDTEVIGDALEKLVRFMDDHEDVGVVTSRVVYPDMSDQGVARSFPTPINMVFGRRSFLTRLLPNNRFSKRYMTSRERTGNEPFEVDWVSGACLMVRREVLQSVGLLDDKFFIYWEDADLCYRIKGAGWRVFCVPDTKVIHHEGKCSEGVKSAWLIWQFNKSAYRYYRKHHIRTRFGLLNVLAFTAILVRTGVLVLASQARSLMGRGRADKRSIALKGAP